MKELPEEHFIKKPNEINRLKYEPGLPEKIFRAKDALEMKAVRLRKRYGLIYEAQDDIIKKDKKSRCEKCGSKSIFQEKIPDIKEISTPNLYRVTVVRYWKCKNCGHEYSTETPENIETEKGDFKEHSYQNLKTSETGWCKYCKKSTCFVEFKKPDIKKIFIFNGYDKITIRYFQCKECSKYREVSIEKEYIDYGI